MSTTLVSAPEAFAPIANRESILNTIADELSPATRRAYAQEMKSLRSYFDTHGWVLFPAGVNGDLLSGQFVEQLLSYLQHLSDEGKTYSTILKTLSAVKHVASYENQLAYAALMLKPTRAFMEGLARQPQMKGHAPKKARAFTLPELSKVYKHLAKDHSPRAVRDRAIVAMGIATALRSSSLAELTLSDISSALTIDGVNVRLRFSKTDQRGSGTYIPVARSSRRKLDPINALREWMGVLSAYGYTAESHPEFPLFPTVRGQRGVMPTKMLNPSIAVTQMLRTLVVDAGVSNELQAGAFSSHSLRATFITLSNQAGVAEKDIAKVSGHKDMTTLRGYDRTAIEQAAQADYLAGGKF